MNKINVGRVVLGGLVAGLVINIGNLLLNRVWVRDELKADLGRLNLSEPGNDFIIRAVVLTFLLGIGIVYLYAAIRPRFGAGMKTAICAGLMAWFFAVLYTGVIVSMVFKLSEGLTVKRIVFGLFQYAIGAVAGAWLYKEEPPPSA
jgi:hypothetical protein